MNRINDFFIAIFLLISFSAYAQTEKKVLKNGDLENDVIVKSATHINSDDLDFSPTYYGEGIVYVSSRHDRGGVDESIDENYFDLYYAPVNSEGIPLKPKPFSLTINSVLHEGPVTFNPLNNEVFFTRNNIKNGNIKTDDDGVIGLKIFSSTKVKDVWMNIKELPFNSDDYSCMHPALSPDGLDLYFASDMPGGYGGMDLYVVRRQGFDWSQPVNLGPKVNTAKDEAFPFMHESGILFFTSEGHVGYGQLDMFMLDRNDVFAQVKNLGQPFNSAADDLGLIVNKKGTSGFFTTSRDMGKGKDDIYYFEAKSGIQNLEIDLSNIVLVPSTAVYDISNLDIDINTLPVDKGTVFVLDKIFYDFDEYTIRETAQDDLDRMLRLMQRYPSMEILLTAHTDARGDYEYNMSLSLKRAEAAEVYLVNRGIAKNRIKAFGFGETQPRNRCVDGVECSEVQHQYNRRTEIRVIELERPVNIDYSNNTPDVIDKKN